MTPHIVSSLLTLLAVEYFGIFLAVLADLISGLRKARRDGIACTSGGLRRTVTKLSSYYLALFCLTVVDCIAITALLTLSDASLSTLSNTGGESIPAFPYLTTLGSISLTLIEAKSIAENSPHHTDFLTAFRFLKKMVKSIRN